MGGRPQDTEDLVRYGAPIHRDEQPDTSASMYDDGFDYRMGRFTSGWGSAANWSVIDAYTEDGRTDEQTGVPYSGFWPLVEGIIETSRPFIRPRLSVFLNRALMGFGLADAAQPNRPGQESSQSSSHPIHRNDPPQGPFPGGWERVTRWPRARTRYRVLGE